LVVGAGKAPPYQGGCQGEQHKISCGHLVLTAISFPSYRTFTDKRLDVI
jgi:hypothetical protein